jgi:malonyl-CoA decarboxylase
MQTGVTTKPRRPRSWLEHVGLIADRGREILNLSTLGRARSNPKDLSRRLLAQRGEASGLALASELVGRLSSMSPDELDAYLETLAADFSPDPKEVARAVERWRAAEDDVDSLLALAAAVEPPRQELFRRLNMAPGGTAAILRLRARLLELLPERPHLRAVDADLRHLLHSWFNRGFLRLEAIDWRSPAALLERLIPCESVHQIDSWESLRRRLEPDRRCFAFFHPALPDEPLIFVEVALTRGLTTAIAPLLDPRQPLAEPTEATTAIFYSINSCQPGLRGISFGNFLIKQVVDELSAELPSLTTFATLSPLPRFAEMLRRDDPDGFTSARLRALLGDQTSVLCQRARTSDLLAAVEWALPRSDLSRATVRALQRLVLAYLTEVRSGNRVLDPVAHFHLSNGAHLERIDLGADRSPKGLRESHGVMVNYVYDLDRVELNHERYVGSGIVATSRSLASERAKVQAAWRAVPA